MKHNPENERIKHEYFEFLKEAKKQNEASVDAAAKALSRFEEYNKYRAFKAFHKKQAIGFKKYLAEQKNKQTGKDLSKATINTTLRHLKTFFNGFIIKLALSLVLTIPILNILIYQKKMRALQRLNAIDPYQHLSK